MLQLKHLESEYAYSSQMSFSGEYSHKPYLTNSVIEFTYKKTNISEKVTQSNDDVIGHIDEIDFKFQLDINKMKIGQRYIFDYHNTKYMAIKNDHGDLELSEIHIKK